MTGFPSSALSRILSWRLWERGALDREISKYSDVFSWLELMELLEYQRLSPECSPSWWLKWRVYQIGKGFIVPAGRRQPQLILEPFEVASAGTGGVENGPSRFRSIRFSSPCDSAKWVTSLSRHVQGTRGGQNDPNRLVLFGSHQTAHQLSVICH